MAVGLVCVRVESREQMDLDEASKVLGIIGGITGPAGLIISYLAFRRDSGRLRVRVARNRRITRGSDDSTVRALLKEYSASGQHPPMELFISDPDKTWAILEVANVGRRKVRLQQIGWKQIGKKFAMPAGFFGYPGSAPWLPCDLEEGEGRDFPVEQGQLANAVYAYARTSTGRTYFGGFCSGWRGAWYRVMTLIDAMQRK